MTGFARGEHAWGLCDRCSFRYPLNELRAETDTGVSKHNRVCPECWDKDHPQNFQHKINHVENTALKDPRPQTDLSDSRTLSAFDISDLYIP